MSEPLVLVDRERSPDAPPALRPRPKPPYTGGRPAWNKGLKMTHPLTDQRSKLNRRVRAIEKALRREYQINRPLWRDRVRMAAKYTALAEQMLAKHGIDVGMFPARAAKLQGSADRLLRMVPLRPRVDRHDLAAVLARTRPEG